MSEQKLATVDQIELMSSLGMSGIQHFDMKTDDFMSIQSHEKQRDTDKRLTRALKTHLGSPIPRHRIVAVAALDGQLWAADGHTRRLGWALGKLEKPETVKVEVSFCSTKEEVLAVYDTYDGKFAVKQPADNLAGACNLHDVELKSTLLSKYRFSQALRVLALSAGEAVEVESLVLKYKKPLMLIDSISPSPPLFKAGLLSGALASLHIRGEKALSLFESINNNTGEKTAVDCDAAHALRELVMKNQGGGIEDVKLLASKTVSAAERWLSGSRYQISQKGISIKATKLNDYLKREVADLEDD